MKSKRQRELYSVDSGRLRSIRRRLLTWFDREKRDLPWRKRRDAYAIWLSESMLQQTQVATVIPYYERFLARFPTVEALAAADLDEVLQLWAGLGYYARARNLHRAAKVVANELGGKFPTTAEGLRELPGVGDYTAGAVASIAFGERAAVVDGNVGRVLARLFEIESDVRTGAGKARVWELARELVPPSRSGDFNQALMELGATVCLPKASAQCLTCPLQTECDAARNGTTTSLPVRTQRVIVKSETHVVAAIESGGKWLFVRRPEDGLWGGLWELPTAVLGDGDSGSGDNGRQTSMLASLLVGSKAGRIGTVAKAPFCEVTHQLTHRTIRFVGHVCRIRGKTPITRRDDERWIPIDEAGTLGISNAMQKVLGELRRAAR